MRLTVEKIEHRHVTFPVGYPGGEMLFRVYYKGHPKLRTYEPVIAMDELGALLKATQVLSNLGFELMFPEEL